MARKFDVDLFSVDKEPLLKEAARQACLFARATLADTELVFHMEQPIFRVETVGEGIKRALGYMAQAERFVRVI